jgi:hypothetical protein
MPRSIRLTLRRCPEIARLRMSSEWTERFWPLDIVEADGEESVLSRNQGTHNNFARMTSALRLCMLGL